MQISIYKNEDELAVQANERNKIAFAYDSTLLTGFGFKALKYSYTVKLEYTSKNLSILGIIDPITFGTSEEIGGLSVFIDNTPVFQQGRLKIKKLVIDDGIYINLFDYYPGFLRAQTNLDGLVELPTYPPLNEATFGDIPHLYSERSYYALDYFLSTQTAIDFNAYALRKNTPSNPIYPIGAWYNNFPGNQEPTLARLLKAPVEYRLGSVPTSSVLPSFTVKDIVVWCLGQYGIRLNTPPPEWVSRPDGMLLGVYSDGTTIPRGVKIVDIVTNYLLLYDVVILGNDAFTASTLYTRGIHDWSDICLATKSISVVSKKIASGEKALSFFKPISETITELGPLVRGQKDLLDPKADKDSVNFSLHFFREWNLSNKNFTKRKVASQQPAAAISSGYSSVDLGGLLKVNEMTTNILFTVDINLPHINFSEFNFSLPIYISALKSYFLISKIKAYRGAGATEVELIKIIPK